MKPIWSPSSRAVALPPLKRKGFSLVEILIAITIATFVLTGATAMFIQFTKTNLSMAARSDFDRQMRVALQNMATDTRVAAAATVSSNSVSLTMPTGSTPQVIYYTYNSGAKELSRSEDNGADQIILNNVSNFSVSQSGDAVSYQVVFSKDVGDRNITLDRNLTFRLRN